MRYIGDRLCEFELDECLFYALFILKISLIKFVDEKENTNEGANLEIK